MVRLFELVAKPEQIQICVSDHGKGLKLTSASGEITMSNGAGGDKLEAKGPFKVGPGNEGIGRSVSEGKPAVGVTIDSEVDLVPS